MGLYAWTIPGLDAGNATAAKHSQWQWQRAGAYCTRSPSGVMAVPTSLHGETAQ
jgi:hypothetical protein